MHLGLEQFSLGGILSFLVGANCVFALPSSPTGDHKDRPYSRDTGNCKPLSVDPIWLMPRLQLRAGAAAQRGFQQHPSLGGHTVRVEQLMKVRKAWVPKGFLGV